MRFYRCTSPTQSWVVMTSAHFYNNVSMRDCGLLSGVADIFKSKADLFNNYGTDISITYIDPFIPPEFQHC